MFVVLTLFVLLMDTLYKVLFPCMQFVVHYQGYDLLNISHMTNLKRFVTAIFFFLGGKSHLYPIHITGGITCIC